jgi:uncharacterized membrane protein
MPRTIWEQTLFDMWRQINPPFLALGAIALAAALVVTLWLRSTYKGYARLQRLNEREGLFFRGMVTLAVVWLGAYSYMSVWRWYKLLNGAWDLGIFWSLMENALHGRFFVDYRGPFDHFQPLGIVYLPFYALWRDARWLLVLQSVALVMAVWPLYLLAKEVSGRKVVGAVAGILYLLYPFLGAGALYDFHILSLTPVCFFSMLLAMARRRWRWYWVAFACLLMVKESEAILAFGAGLYLAAQSRWTPGAVGAIVRGRRPGPPPVEWKVAALTIAISVAWFFLSTLVLFPVVTGVPYRHLGRYEGYGEVVKEVFATERGIAMVGAYAARVVAVFLFVTLPLGFLMLRRPMTALLVFGPYFAVNILSRAMYQNIFYGHYTITVAAAALGATALATEGMKGFEKDEKPTILPLFLVITALLSNLFFSWPASSRLLYPMVHLYVEKSFNFLGMPLPATDARKKFYRQDEHERFFTEAQALFPEGSTIATQNSLGYFFAVGHKLKDLKELRLDEDVDYYLFDVKRGDSMHTPPEVYRMLLDTLQHDAQYRMFLRAPHTGDVEFVFFSKGDKWIAFYENALAAAKREPENGAYLFTVMAVEKAMNLPPSEVTAGAREQDTAMSGIPEKARRMMTRSTEPAGATVESTAAAP